MRIPIAPGAYWSPLLSERHAGVRPPVGALIALNRRPVRIVAINEIPQVDWKDEARQTYLEEKTACVKVDKPFPALDEWRRRPFVIIVRPAAQAAPVNENAGTKSFTVLPYRTIPDWYLLPDHYAVCVACGELSPCRDLLAEREAARQAAILDRRLSVLPGCCWSCHEPITSRMKVVTFEGPNLEIPGGPEPVSFHLRRDCHYAAVRYEELWVRQDPRRRPTLRCPGHFAIHLDGEECSEGVLCVGAGVSHAKGWEDHTYYVRDQRMRPQLLEYVERYGMDEKVRERALYRCLRCFDAFTREGPEA